jgi:hypothetical protein
VTMPAYEVCYMCKGSGLQDGLYGPANCYVCRGDCYIIAGGAGGKFISYKDIDKENESLRLHKQVQL